MPFKSDKQRKWMHANEPEMAKKWEKEEAIRGKLQNLIKQEIKSINEGFEKYHLGGLLDSRLKKISNENITTSTVNQRRITYRRVF